MAGAGIIVGLCLLAMSFVVCVGVLACCPNRCKKGCNEYCPRDLEYQHNNSANTGPPPKYDVTGTSTTV